MPAVESANNVLQGVGAETDEGQMVVFNLSSEEFGVDINNVKEIVRLPEITPIPCSPGYVSGICNLRGNVLPVIDSRLRFSMDSKDSTDQSRLLVVEKNGLQTGLVVDQMREVMRVKNSLVESPPAVCRGVDREFLSGVVKVDEGKRLILMLALDDVINVNLDHIKRNETIEMDRSENAALDEGSAAEEHLVSFRVSNDEYAFDIVKVREILKVTDITSVPNVPDYVKGLFTIRNNLLPIIELRGLLGLPDLITERLNLIDNAKTEDNAWAENLRHLLDTTNHFTGIASSKETTFGKWLEGYTTSSVEVENVVKQLKRERSDLYGLVGQTLEKRSSNNEEAITFYNDRVEPLLNIVLDRFEELKTCMQDHIQEDQRTLVVESGTMTIGYLVDHVDEVIRIPHSVIDDTPAMASSERKELKAVARLDEGKRLIMIMDESALVSHDTEEMLSEIKAQTDVKTDEQEQEKTLAEESLDEEQLVTFTIAKEEYGIRIMQIQEINRIKEITRVPRAPFFIDGMTNLRGEVIPVINVRKLFDLDDRKIDDATRIIIVDIQGNKTGLRVDQVNEVLRLAKQDIEETSSIVTSDGMAKLIQGVCKIDKGKRLVMLLDMEKILDKKELKALNRMGKSETKKPTQSGKTDTTKKASVSTSASKEVTEGKASPKRKATNSKKRSAQKVTSSKNTGANK